MSEQFESRSIFCSGLAVPASGIGVVQRWVYPLLEHRGWALMPASSQVVGGSVLFRVTRVVRTLLTLYPAGSKLLTVATPFPLFPPPRTVAIVLDLRWLSTRGRIARAYRSWDLKRTIRRAQTLLCISERTREDLVEFSATSATKARVAWLGPGIIPEGSFRDGEPGVVLLVGGARHKRNEYAATMLVEARPPWLTSIEGVGISREARAIFEGALGTDQCRWHDRVPDAELIEVYLRSDYFVLFGVDEGFGLPFVEALSAGCKVVAIDQPLTRELLGEAGCLIEEGTSDAVAAQLRAVQPPSEAMRRLQASKFSWSVYADTISTALGEMD